MAERKSRRRFLAEGALALAGVAAGASGEAGAAPDAGDEAHGHGQRLLRDARGGRRFRRGPP